MLELKFHFQYCLHKEKQQTSDVGPLLHAYLMLARYADSQYQRVTRHMTSTAYDTKKQLLEKSQLELQKLSATMSKDAQLKNRFENCLCSNSSLPHSSLPSTLPFSFLLPSFSPSPSVSFHSSLPLPLCVPLVSEKAFQDSQGSDRGRRDIHVVSQRRQTTVP